MNIGRNEVNEFQKASTAPTTGEVIVRIGTANPKTNYKVKVTDIKAVCGSTGRTFVIKVKNGYSAKPISFALAANSTHNWCFTIPYTFNIVSSSGADYSVIASASGAGVDYIVTGYIEK